MVPQTINKTFEGIIANNGYGKLNNTGRIDIKPIFGE